MNLRIANQNYFIKIKKMKSWDDCSITKRYVNVAVSVLLLIYLRYSKKILYILWIYLKKSYIFCVLSPQTYMFMKSINREGCGLVIIVLINAFKIWSDNLIHVSILERWMHTYTAYDILCWRSLISIWNNDNNDVLIEHENNLMLFISSFRP